MSRFCKGDRLHACTGSGLLDALRPSTLVTITSDDVDPPGCLPVCNQSPNSDAHAAPDEAARSRPSLQLEVEWDEQEAPTAVYTPQVAAAAGISDVHDPSQSLPLPYFSARTGKRLEQPVASALPSSGDTRLARLGARLSRLHGRRLWLSVTVMASVSIGGLMGYAFARPGASKSSLSSTPRIEASGVRVDAPARVEPAERALSATALKPALAAASPTPAKPGVAFTQGKAQAGSPTNAARASLNDLSLTVSDADALEELEARAKLIERCEGIWQRIVAHDAAPTSGGRARLSVAGHHDGEGGTEKVQSSKQDPWRQAARCRSLWSRGVSLERSPDGAGAPIAGAYLRVASRPLSQVYVDGKLLGMAPQLGVELQPGKHTLQLQDPTTGRTCSKSVLVSPGRIVTRLEDLHGCGVDVASAAPRPQPARDAKMISNATTKNGT